MKFFQYEKIRKKLFTGRVFFVFVIFFAILIAVGYFYFFKKAEVYPVLRNKIRETTVVKKNFPFVIPKKIGWVSDIHADRFKRRQVDSGLLFPRHYKDYLPKVFDEMKAQGIDTVISTGDNTNSCDDNYSEDIKKIAAEKNMYVVWVRGNHDCDETMASLGVKQNNGKYFYFYDYADKRIIILDDTQMNPYDYLGSIDETQLGWFREILKTDKKVIIAMHIPMFADEMLMERYAELEKIIHESGNVKLVLAGHYHTTWKKNYNGIEYKIEGALTRDGMEGEYAVIDWNNFSVENKIAK